MSPIYKRKLSKFLHPLRKLAHFFRKTTDHLLLSLHIQNQKSTPRKLTHLFRPSKKTLVLIAAIASITVVAHTLVATWLTDSEIINIATLFNTSSRGTIRVTGVAAYGGDIKTINDTNIVDWRTFYPGVSNNASFYLESISNIPIKLAYNVTDWSPKRLVSYMTLTWNYNYTALLPHEQIYVNFTLSLSSSTDTINYLIDNNVTSFSFNINIYTLEP